MKEIIVYRNPLEAALWNLIMNNGLEILAFVIVAMFVTATVHHFGEKYVYRTENSMRKINQKKDALVKISVVLGLIAGCLAIVGVQILIGA
jgi:hypothetical protein